jgi:glycosyltransferase involved in cell wall biosynthesis
METSNRDSAMPLVSVIIPAFNASRYIKHTLTSVLEQYYNNIETIVVDDGSTDDTGKAVGEFGNKVIYVRKENGGQGSARNAGMAVARGAFFAFVDADDVWLPTKLSSQMELFDLHPELGLVYSDAIGFDQETGKDLWCFSQRTRFYGGDVLRYLLLCNFVPTLTVVIRREVWEQVGGFSETKGCVEDWEIWLRIASLYHFGFVNARLAKYRLHNQSYSAQLSRGTEYRVRFSILEDALERDPAKLWDLRRSAISSLQLNTGKLALLASANVEARRMLVQAFRTDPSNSRAIAYLFLSLFPAGALRSLVSLRNYWREYAARRLVGAQS